MFVALAFGQELVGLAEQARELRPMSPDYAQATMKAQKSDGGLRRLPTFNLPHRDIGSH